MKKTPILTALVGATLLTGLAGCTASVTTSSDGQTKNPSPSTSASPAESTDKYTDKCVEGVAHIYVDEDKKEKTLEGQCDTVWILGDGGTVHLDNVKDIGIMGNRNTVDVNTVSRVDAEGDNNTITHGGNTPESVGDGKNTALTRK